MDNNNIKQLIANFKNDVLSHAILFETNDIQQCYKDIITLSKNIFWQKKPKDYINYYNLIEQNTFPDLTLIEPIKGMIRKEEVTNLIGNFMLKPEFSDNKIYIIREVEKMNESAANSILKFLEEPQDNIYGFLITNNREMVMPTIKSRCQYIRVDYEDDFYKKNDILPDVRNELIVHVRKIIELSVQKKLPQLFLYKQKFIGTVKDREILIKFLKILKNYYCICLNFEIATAVEDENLIKFIQDTNNNQTIIEKIKIIDKIINNCYFNVNIDLVIEKLFIEMVR